MSCPYTLFELPLSWLWLPLCPLGLFGLATRPDSYTFCPPVITVIWEDYFPSCMFSVPPEVPAFTPPRPPCTTPLNRGLWQPGKGMSQKKNMPHGKLDLFPSHTQLKEMSQAYPENWVRVAAPLPTSVRLR